MFNPNKFVSSSISCLTHKSSCHTHSICWMPKIPNIIDEMEWRTKPVSVYPTHSLLSPVDIPRWRDTTTPHTPPPQKAVNYSPFPVTEDNIRTPVNTAKSKEPDPFLLLGILILPLSGPNIMKYGLIYSVPRFLPRSQKTTRYDTYIWM